jgi:hypothetical protein
MTNKPKYQLFNIDVNIDARITSGYGTLYVIHAGLFITITGLAGGIPRVNVDTEIKKLILWSLEIQR